MAAFPSHNMLLNYFFSPLRSLVNADMVVQPSLPPTCCVHEPALTLVGQTSARSRRCRERHMLQRQPAKLAGERRGGWGQEGERKTLRAICNTKAPTLAAQKPPSPTTTSTAGARRHQPWKQPSSCSTEGSFTGRQVCLGGGGRQ